MNNAILSTCVPNEEQMQLAKREAENFIKNQKSDFKKLNDNVEENKKRIEETGDKIEKCGQQKIEDIKGKSFLNLVTGDVLKTALVDLTQDQLTSIYKPLLDLLDITNRNLETISKINQGIMALQFIMAYQVVANTKVETERAERISQLSEKIKNGNITLEELIDLASETSELQEKRAIEINNILQKLSDENTTINDKINKLNKRVEERHADVLKKIRDTNNDVNDVREQLELRIKETGEKREQLAEQVDKYHIDVLKKIESTNNAVDGVEEQLELKIKETDEKREQLAGQVDNYRADLIEKIEASNSAVNGIKEQLELRINGTDKKTEEYYESLKSLSDVHENRLNLLEKKTFFDSIFYKVFVGAVALCALILSFLTLCG